jgi:hypothetical protein
MANEPILQVKVNAVLVRHGLQMLGDDIPKVSRLVIYRRAQAIQQRMKVPGARPSYPIQWDSEKQRKAFFATKGFGKGIPYRRTGDYIAGWKVTKLGEIGYRVGNEKKQAGPIAGDIFGTQSRIHRGRWTHFRKAIDEELKNLPQEIRNEITISIKRNVPS